MDPDGSCTGTKPKQVPTDAEHPRKAGMSLMEPAKDRGPKKMLPAIASSASQLCPDVSNARPPLALPQSSKMLCLHSYVHELPRL